MREEREKESGNNLIPPHPIHQSAKRTSDNTSKQHLVVAVDSKLEKKQKGEKRGKDGEIE